MCGVKQKVLVRFQGREPMHIPLFPAFCYFISLFLIQSSGGCSHQHHKPELLLYLSFHVCYSHSFHTDSRLCNYVCWTSVLPCIAMCTKHHAPWLQEPILQQCAQQHQQLCQYIIYLIAELNSSTCSKAEVPITKKETLPLYSTVQEIRISRIQRKSSQSTKSTILQIASDDRLYPSKQQYKNRTVD